MPGGYAKILARVQKSQPAAKPMDAILLVLFDCVNSGNSEVLAELFAKRINFNVKDSEGFTPLHRATMAGQVACMRVLLDGGASVDSIDLQNRTPLHWAALHGSVRCVRLLLESGANKDKTDSDGKKPLELADQGNKWLCINELENPSQDLRLVDVPDFCSREKGCQLV